MRRSTQVVFILLCSTSLLLPGPVWLKLFQQAGSSIQVAKFQPKADPSYPSNSADLDQDGISETINLFQSRLSIIKAGQTVWESPLEWQIRQAQFADLNRDGRTEVVLIVWRPFNPWPIDQFIPHSGRIQEFQNSEGLSCHIILIGWNGNRYKEAWAGSSLAEPVQEMVITDLNSDGFQELISLDGRYDDINGQFSRGLSVWEWNGFGFTLIARQTGSFKRIAPLATQSGNQLLVEAVPQWRQQ